MRDLGRGPFHLCVRARGSCNHWAPVLGLGLGLSLALAGPLPAQTDSPPDRRLARGVAIPALQLTRLGGGTAWMTGGWVGIRIGERWVLGGGGLMMLSPASVTDTGDFGSLELGMGYGGLFVRTRLGQKRWLDGGAQLVLGAGNAQLTSPEAGAELGSSNVIVAEPQLTLEAAWSDSAALGLGAGYRLAIGGTDLPGFSSGDLSGFSLNAFLRLETGGGH